MNLFDDDAARDAELIAQQWAEYHARVRTELADLRERVVTVATCRMVGQSDGKAVEAMNEHLSRLDLELMADMLVRALWDGGRSADREARTRLLQLRDMTDVTGVLDAINQGSV